MLETKYEKDLIKIQIKTNKQAGDIAGTKLKKFYEYFNMEVLKSFDIKASDFEYDDKNNLGLIFLVVKQKKQLIIMGPPIKMKEAVISFKKHHKTTRIKAGRIYTTKKSMRFNEFLKEFLVNKKTLIKEMSIKDIRVL